MIDKRPLELIDAVEYVLDAVRRRQALVSLKIQGVRSSTTVRSAIITDLQPALRIYRRWDDEEIRLYCESIRVELHAVESDGNWYDIFVPVRV